MTQTFKSMIRKLLKQVFHENLMEKSNIFFLENFDDEISKSRNTLMFSMAPTFISNFFFFIFFLT